MIITACSGPAEPTPIPTIEPTKTPETVQIKILPSEVLVKEIILSEPDEATGEMEVVVKGSASNTCTSVDGLTVSRDGDIFELRVETTVSTSESCESEAVPFEETISVSTVGLTPGTYLIASGAVVQFAFGEQAEEPGEVPSEGEGAESTPEDDIVAGSEGDTEAGGTTETPTGTEAEPAEAEPRDCEDLAAFVADVTYPDNTNVQPGEIITKTWEISNQGTCTWGTGYELKFTSGSFSEVASLSDPFPETAPSDSVELSVLLTVPEDSGTHSGVWVIQRPEEDNVEVQAGKAFDLWAIVRVAVGTVGTGGTNDTQTRKEGVVCAQANSVYEGQLLQLINNVRAANELPPYEAQSQLTDAARVLTEDMACNDFVDHTGTDGLDWFDRITAQGYIYRDAAENILFGYGTVPELAFNWWMDSQVHRGNILNSDLTQIGIAYALNPQTGGSYYTLVFAVPEE
jgi:uncharacterized protein YkwD